MNSGMLRCADFWLRQRLSREGADTSLGTASPGDNPAGSGAHEAYLPPRGIERQAFLLLAALVLG